MSTHTKNHPHKNSSADDSMSDAASKDPHRGRSVAITWTLPEHVDNDAADRIRQDLRVAISKLFVHRLGKVPVDLIVH